MSNSPVFGVTGKVDYIIHTEEDSNYEIKAKVPEEKSKDSKKDYSLFMKAPIAVNILNGPELIIEMANASSLEIWGKGEEVMGQSLLKILPELVSQGYKDLAGQILKTGIPHHAYEQHVTLFRNGEEHDAYFNWVIQPFYQEVDGEATGIITFANEVTDQLGGKKERSGKGAELRPRYRNCGVGHIHH